MFWSFAYLVLRCLLQLVLLRRRSGEFKELELIVLRHELSVLRRAGRPSAARAGRPAAARGGEPTAAPIPLELVLRVPDDTAFAGIGAWGANTRSGEVRGLLRRR